MLSIRTTIQSFKDAVSAAAWRMFPGTTCVTLPKLSASLQYSSVSRDMVDPKKVVSYEDMLEVVKRPEKVIIDVRNPEEVSSNGKIPSSINIPLGNMQEVFSSMPEEQFERQFRRPKPTTSDEIIFYCQSGRRSTEALDKALKMGYSNSKTYLGSWNDWSSRSNM